MDLTAAYAVGMASDSAASPEVLLTLLETLLQRANATLQ
jgi:hypothetical protein